MTMQNIRNATLQEIVKPVKPYLERVDEEIRKKLMTGIPLLDETALHLFKRGGKKIRASLIILSSGLKNEIPDDIIEIAAAAEIVHGASLIHDDIIDQSTLRRGDLTISKKWGNKIAVLAGDFMYTKALEIYIGEDRFDLFPTILAAALDMIKGEIYQIEYSNIDIINKEHYFKIIELKTARFMAICAKIGAVKGNMSDEESDILYNSGLNMGYAFQIVDDTLDFMDDFEYPVKDTGSDFLSGKITLPFLHLIENSDKEEKDLLTDFARNPDIERWEIVKQKIKSSKTFDYCIRIARNYIDTAIKYLDFFPSTIYKEVIINLSNFLVERKY